MSQLTQPTPLAWNTREADDYKHQLIQEKWSYDLPSPLYLFYDVGSCTAEQIGQKLNYLFPNKFPDFGAIEVLRHGAPTGGNRLRLRFQTPPTTLPLRLEALGVEVESYLYQVGYAECFYTEEDIEKHVLYFPNLLPTAAAV